VTAHTVGGGVELLQWDTEHFGMPIGRVMAPDGPEAIVAAVETADRAGLHCITALIEAAHANMIGAAEDHGFRFFDVRTELDRQLDGEWSDDTGTHIASEEDLPILEPIARTRFLASRFYADPNFPRDRVDALYVAWLQRGLAENDRLVISTPERDGFVVCHVDSHSRVGTVELIAVAEQSEGKGRGGRLLGAAHAAFAAKGLTHARVVTQGANLAAQRLYQRHGYRTSGVALWLHRWMLRSSVRE
jgi:dTDP-4-amino-4,6-dideoxy-D-galactose acyltransferase